MVQTMCNTHTDDIEATVAQTMRLAAAGAQIVRITCPGLQDVECMKEIRSRLRDKGCTVPLVADIHFSARTAIAVAPFVEKVRINPGNFHKDPQQAAMLLKELVSVCKEHGTAIRIGLNHGSLGEHITSMYGNTPEGMAQAAMHWINMCTSEGFHNIVVSLKASNTVTMTEAYRRLQAMMEESGEVYPLHVGVTEAGGGDSGRIKSCVGISTLLAEGIGDTIRVSLTEDPEAEIPVARYLSDRYSGTLRSSLRKVTTEGRRILAGYEAPSREKLLLDASCDFGRSLLLRQADDISFSGTYTAEDGRLVSLEDDGFAGYLSDELMQACRRRFYRPEYIACPGCGRTMYDLQDALREVMERTFHLKDTVIAVMGCIVNGPGEMADADWGYVGEGGGKVSIYKGKEPVLTHVPSEIAVDKLLELIEGGR